MKLILSKPRGFCAGVERAIDTVKRALELWGAPIYVKHEIVHNRHVVEDLKQRGAVFVEELADVPLGARVIYSAHGVSPSVREEAKARGLIEIDATCGLVTKVHSAAKRFAERGYHIILIGHRKHVEIIGTKGEAPEATTVVESVEEVEKLPFGAEAKLAYLTQTTLSLDDVNEISQALIRRFPKIETLPSSSICYATTNRQMALRDIAEKVHLILVIGDPKSSNSNRLREVAERRGILAFLINGPNEIQLEWLQGVSAIGMTAGASTPEEIVQACVERLREFGVISIEEAVFVEENVFFQLPKAVLSRLPSEANLLQVSEIEQSAGAKKMPTGAPE
jgi:4-hydroxy-3-methylbut-2-enyl diphosphate reductase